MVACSGTKDMFGRKLEIRTDFAMKIIGTNMIGIEFD